MPMITIMRFLAGLAGSCPITIGSGTIADCWRQEERGFVMSSWSLPILLGPTLGPVIGKLNLEEAQSMNVNEYQAAMLVSMLGGDGTSTS